MTGQSSVVDPKLFIADPDPTFFLKKCDFKT
jgi:hypothetical protein